MNNSTSSATGLVSFVLLTVNSMLLGRWVKTYKKITPNNSMIMPNMSTNFYPFHSCK